MKTKTNISFAISIFDGENYHARVVKMLAYLEGGDIWDAEEDYDMQWFLENPTVAVIKYQKERKTRKAAKSCLFAVINTIFARIMNLG